ncbi:hypothetical protein A0J61_02728 [Choanephora cucurbitarum]|uniref:Uncharacterized protein n=1 Tax=Choanephora cucurbitarum TaxID=101091 RepID=A0A1C7NJ88_9FUNG|nr:hypothetical protein A0J61_02728 [Choanephora cucurbitarum]
MKLFHKKPSNTAISFTDENELKKVYLSVFEPYALKKKLDGNTLSYMMSLFEEKTKPLGYPLPIKANGAIVVHRPNDIHDSFEDIDAILDPILPNTEETSQILMEREQTEKWRITSERYQQELACAEQTIRQLKRTVDRFEKLISFRDPKLQYVRHSRRQSTGSGLYHTMADAYERKLQILLNEIEAMEQQEVVLIKQLAQKSNACDRLYTQMSYKDDMIRQLAYHLQLERHK